MQERSACPVTAWRSPPRPPSCSCGATDASSSPGRIKGTGRTETDLLEKDYAENVMIVDLVRNDIGRVCATGSVTVPDLCAVEKHPGLVHLVSTVRGELGEGGRLGRAARRRLPARLRHRRAQVERAAVIDALETAPEAVLRGDRLGRRRPAGR
ncbi:hypothetical protein SVIOM74S_06164 [Streptomyces violarus]